MANIPSWYGGSEDSWNYTADQAPGIWAAIRTFYMFGSRMQMAVEPVPAEYTGLYVPWPWQHKVLPMGAFKSLFPNSRGNDWSKVKPEGFGVGWRPTGPARPEAWE